MKKAPHRIFIYLTYIKGDEMQQADNVSTPRRMMLCASPYKYQGVI